MPSDSPRLLLPYVAEAQSQKHVTVNEAFQRLDVLAQLSVEGFDVDTPPLSASDGQVWALGPAPLGDWAGQAGALAVWANGGWLFMAPRPGWIAVHQTEVRVWSGSGWVAQDLPDLSNLPGLGVNASYDGTNRLSVAAAATLLTHDGAGHQLKINKNDAADTASVLFQTGWTGRAEMGTSGSNDFAIKVSDGSTWRTGLTVDTATAAVSIPQDLATQGLLRLGAYGTGARRDATTGLTTQFLLGVDATGSVTEVPTTGAALVEGIPATQNATIDVSALEGLVRLDSDAANASYSLPAGIAGQRLTLIGARPDAGQIHTVTAHPGVVILHDPMQDPGLSAGSFTLRNTETVTLVWRAAANGWVVVGRSRVPDSVPDSVAALGGVTGSPDVLPYFTGPDAMATTAFSGFARTLLDDADAQTARATLGMAALGFSGGNVGIGTNNPPYPLVISNNGASGIEYGPGYSGTANLIQHYNRSGGAYCDAVNDAAQHRFNIGGTERARIDASGNLLVGTQAMIGSYSNANDGFCFGGGGGVNWAWFAGDTDASPNYTMYVQSLKTTGTRFLMAFINGGAAVGSITSNGTSTSFNTSSDYRLKDDIRPMADATARVLALNPVNFAWRLDGSRVDGFLAHEVQALIPEAVTGDKDAVRMETYQISPAQFDADGNQIAPAELGTREVPVFQSIDHSKLIPLLTAALQEALHRIEVLEAAQA